ncbi:MAG: hypothetical protein IPN34_22605 [Planctomycetes bacterium]|nr:hypothetical protein [Planctomycetota bacterium]
MHRPFRTIIPFAAAVACAAPLVAQTTAISYQGRLQIAGQPVNGSADLRFSLFTNQVLPGQVGSTLTFTNQTVVDGLVALELDFGADAWTSGLVSERFLQVEVRTPAGAGSYVALSPRQRVTAAPFSIATRGIRVGTTSSRIGIGVPSGVQPIAKLHVSDNAATAFGNHAMVVESSGNNGADGIAIKISDPRGFIDKENNYVTFLDAADRVAGRIEGFSRLQNNFVPPPPIPNVISIDWDPGRAPSWTFDAGRLPNATFSGGSAPSLICSNGALPSLTFSQGTAPSQSFSPGTSPSLNMSTTNLLGVNVFTGFTFNPGTLPSSNFNPGSLPTATFNPGQLPTCTLSPGSFPSLIFDAGTLPRGSFDPGQLPFPRGFAVTPPTQAEMLALICWAQENGMSALLGKLMLLAAGGPTILQTALTRMRGAAETCLDQGVVYASKGADYAEWLPKAHDRQEFFLGQVVGIKSGRVNIGTEDAEQLLVISAQPIVLGNEPPAGERDRFAKVAMMGQVPVLTRGKVLPGDYLVPSGLSDGTAIAVAPENLAARHLPFVIGRAWGASTDEELSLVNTAIGLEDFGAAKVLVAQEKLHAEQHAELRTDNEQLRTRVAELESTQQDLLTRLAALEALTASLDPKSPR